MQFDALPRQQIGPSAPGCSRTTLLFSALDYAIAAAAMFLHCLLRLGVIVDVDDAAINHCAVDEEGSIRHARVAPPPKRHTHTTTPEYANGPGAALSAAVPRLFQSLA